MDGILAWYSGYNCTGETVYNPFDLLLLFDTHQFRPCCFRPTFRPCAISESPRRGSVSIPSAYEGFYVSAFYSYFGALGLDIRTEDSTNHGQIDMAVVFAGQVYVFVLRLTLRDLPGCN